MWLSPKNLIAVSVLGALSLGAVGALAATGQAGLDALVADLETVRQAPSRFGPAADNDPALRAIVNELRAVTQAQTEDVAEKAADSGRVESGDFTLELTDNAGTDAESDPLATKIGALARSLQAVKAADVELPFNALFYDAQAAPEEDLTEEEAADVSADEAVEPVEEAPEMEVVEPEPEPPAPREAPKVIDTTEANADLSSRRMALDAANMRDEAVSDGPAPTVKAYSGDPLNRRVNLDFREMELSNVVALLAHMADINVIAGTDLTGTVTANLKDVPLRQAIDTALRMNGLGLLEEEGIYHIVPYDEAIAAQRDTIMITLENAKAKEVRTVLEEILKGSPDERSFSLSSNDTANIVVISGPETKVSELASMVSRLDVAEPVLPTVTEAIKLNYSEPEDLQDAVEKMLTPTVGQVAADNRARHLIVTDVPVVVEQVRSLVATLDMPTKEVSIDTMVVDVNLDDAAETGVDWLLNSIRRQSRRDAALGNDTAVGNLQELALDTNLASGATAGLLNFALLGDNLDWRGVIQAEVRQLNGKLISNPVVVTVENKPATIEIVQEIPYIELTQTNAGGSQTNTAFKLVGTTLEVTPRVTHDDVIIADVSAKESFVNGQFNGVPIEDKRQLTSTARLKSGQTIFMGGLRKRSDSHQVTKVPVLGDIPVLNVLFRRNLKSEETNELLIFMTCEVISEDALLKPHQQLRYEESAMTDTTVQTEHDIVENTIHPGKMREPIWRWRRPAE